jgi:dCMP deaminase
LRSARFRARAATNWCDTASSGHPHCLDIGCARQGVPSGQRSELCRSAHAEQNAINFAARYGISIEGATLYTTHYPCSWCAKSIVNAGIVRVIYDEDYPDPLSKEILSAIQVQRIGNSSELCTS